VINKMHVTNFHLAEELEQMAAELSKETGRHVEAGFDVFAMSVTTCKNNNQEWHYVRKDGTTFFVSLNITQLKDAQKDISGYLGIAVDISEKKKADTELRAALEKEKELNELKSRFVSMASHEFRTPLSAVLSSAYLVSRYQKTEEQAQREKHLQRIVASVTSLTEILEDFLSVGKIEEGNIEANFKEYDIKAQMQVVVQDVQHLLKKGQTIVYKHEGTNPLVYLDVSMTKHIVMNLLSNAIKFSEEGSIIDLTSNTAGGKIQLSVQDHGLGIPEEDLENLYKRFFRSSNATNIQGTGLGLHIVSKYTEMMQGVVTCESKLGKGTKFIVTFNNHQSL